MKNDGFLGVSFHPVALLTLVLGLLLAIPNARAGVDDGIAAYNRGDYSKAHAEFRRWAEQGDATAQFNLGVMYYKGQGVQQDYAEAVKWWRQAAEQGEPDAQFLLGIAYENGYGVPEDHVEALKWCHQAAEQGHAEAQAALGPVEGERARQVAERRRQKEEQLRRAQAIEEKNRAERAQREAAERERMEEAERNRETKRRTQQMEQKRRAQALAEMQATGEAAAAEFTRQMNNYRSREEAAQSRWLQFQERVMNPIDPRTGTPLIPTGDGGGIHPSTGQYVPPMY